MHYSFDIFDTCLIRTCGFSHNVFDILALRTLGVDSSESLRADFVNSRITAEARARKRKKGEVTLQEIYDEFDFPILTLKAKNDILKKEIDIERDVLVAVSSIQNKIVELHECGISVLYISDMYLPEVFIKEILVKYGFWKDGDKLYVSCEVGATKNEGTLYDLVARDNNLSYQHWHHYGDNYYSDYVVPKKKGIIAHKVTHSFSNYEKQLLQLSLYPGVFLNQIMAGIQKAVRLSFKGSPQVDLASNIVIPLMTGFVNNILENAKKEKIEKLYFLSRDGYLPYYIACLLHNQYPEIELEYFYTSRSALYFPGIDVPSEDCLLLLLGKKKKKKLKEVFADKTNIDISQFISTEEFDKVIMSKDEGINKIHMLYENPHFVKTINNEYLEQKGLTVEYLEQIGLASTKYSNAIVDVRGTRKCHKIINKLLNEAGYPSVKGYYLEVTGERELSLNAGDYYSEFYGERYVNDTDTLKNMGSLYSVIEQYFCATGSLRTIKYKKENGIVLPVYEEGSSSQIGNDLCVIHKKIAEKYVLYYTNNMLYLYNKEILPFIYYNLFSFARIPYRRDLLALMNIMSNDDRFHYVSLIRKYSFVQILKRKFDCKEWIRGSLVYSVYSWIGESIGRKVLSKLIK